MGKQRAQVAEFFHTQADETSPEILDQLKEGKRCVGELTEALQTGQSRLSFRLKVPKDSGLIHDRSEGPIEVLIWLMIIPMMTKVDVSSIRQVGTSPTGIPENRRHAFRREGDEIVWMIRRWPESGPSRGI